MASKHNDVIKQRDAGFTHNLNVETSEFDQNELGFTLTQPDKLSSVQLCEKKFIQPLKAELIHKHDDVITQRDAGFTFNLNVETSEFDQNELGLTLTQPDKLAPVKLYEKRFTLPLRAKLIHSLNSERRLDEHMRDLTSICMARLIVEPAECVIKIGKVEVPLHPPTEYNLLRLREAFVIKHKSMSLILKF